MKVKRKQTYARAMTTITRKLAKQNTASALNFIDEVEAAEELLRQSPGIGRFYDKDHSRLSTLQVYVLPKFKSYLVFYCVESDLLVMVHLLHGARDLPKTLIEESE